MPEVLNELCSADFLITEVRGQFSTRLGQTTPATKAEKRKLRQKEREKGVRRKKRKISKPLQRMHLPSMIARAFQNRYLSVVQVQMRGCFGTPALPALISL